MGTSGADDRWTCPTCGKEHAGASFQWGYAKPDLWLETSEDERGPAAWCNEDACVMLDVEGNQAFFVRGLIEIPIRDPEPGGPESLGLGVWVSLSEKNFVWYLENPEAGAEEQGEPWFGWLSTEVSVFGEPTQGLRTDVVIQGATLRPRIYLQRAWHPLARDVRGGLTLRRASQLDAALWHRVRGEPVDVAAIEPGWPVPLPAELGVFTTRQILEEGAELVRVTHDWDGDWQFLDWGPEEGERDVADLRLVCLRHVVELWPGVVARFADLEPGVGAWRDDDDPDAWEVDQLEPDEDDEG